MKRAYQKRAVADTTTVEVKQAVQIALPMAEVLTSLEQGLGELVRKVGRIFIESVLESEVEQIAGPRSCRAQTRQAYRWGVEQGSCVIDGQRVPIARPRVRQCGRGGKELPLGTYQTYDALSDPKIRLSPSFIVNEVQVFSCITRVSLTEKSCWSICRLGWNETSSHTDVSLLIWLVEYRNEFTLPSLSYLSSVFRLSDADPNEDLWYSAAPR